MSDNPSRWKMPDGLSAEIVRLHSLGWKAANIALHLGGISEKRVAQHIWWKTMDPRCKQERDARRNGIRRKRDREFREATKDMAAGTVSPRPPAHILAERDCRYARPFSIAFDVLGDPEPGRSALDHKLAEARA